MAAVSRFLADSRLVGRIGEGIYPYFEAVQLPMQWQVIRGSSYERNTPSPDAPNGIAFFATVSKYSSTHVYLTGSPRHVLGAVPDDAALSFPGNPGASFLPALRDKWRSFDGLNEPEDYRDGLTMVAEEFSAGLTRPVEHLSFLARNLNTTNRRVFGSPIWVALEVPGS